MQGMMDAFQILCGLGILSTNENVEKIIARLKMASRNKWQAIFCYKNFIIFAIKILFFYFIITFVRGIL